MPEWACGGAPWGIIRAAYSRLPLERPHSALADRTPAGFAELYRDVTGKASTSMARNPRQTRRQGLTLPKTSSFVCDRKMGRLTFAPESS